MTSPVPHSNEKDRNNNVVPIRMADYQGWVHKKYGTEPFKTLMNTFLSQTTDMGTAIKVSQRSAVFCLKHDKGTIYVKRYRCESFKSYCQTLLENNRAQKSWRIGNVLLKKGINIPLPILYIRRRLSFFKSDHIVATKGIQNSISLRDYIAENFSSDNKRLKAKRLLIKQVAVFLGHLHLAGIYHGDLTARNIVIQYPDESEQMTVFLIDLDSVRSTHRISTRRRIKNLDELGRNFLDLNIIGIHDRAWFLKYYLETYTKDKKGFRDLFMDVRKRTRHRLNKHGQQFSKIN